jgi:hypothetical protein
VALDAALAGSVVQTLLLLSVPDLSLTTVSNTLEAVCAAPAVVA